jgi:hypothetical protein
MSALSNYLENELIDHVLRNTPYTSPGTDVWVALYTDDPTDADTGTEVSGGSYARVQVTAWDAPSDGDTENTNEIAFAQATANWGTVTHVGIRDASTAGNLLWHGSLTASKTVNDGDTFKIAAGDLDVTLA